MVIYQISGAIGLILIIAGILLKKRRNEDILYILGGLCLLSYSISIKDPIFIPLQIIFVIAAIFDYTKRKK